MSFFKVSKHVFSFLMNKILNWMFVTKDNPREQLSK